MCWLAAACLLAADPTTALQHQCQLWSGGRISSSAHNVLTSRLCISVSVLVHVGYAALPAVNVPVMIWVSTWHQQVSTCRVAFNMMMPPPAPLTRCFTTPPRATKTLTPPRASRTSPAAGLLAAPLRLPAHPAPLQRCCACVLLRVVLPVAGQACASARVLGCCRRQEREGGKGASITASPSNSPPTSMLDVTLVPASPSYKGTH